VRDQAVGVVAQPVYTIRMKNFDALSEQEILALAISLEEEHERVYADFAEGLEEAYPATAKIFFMARFAVDSRRCPKKPFQDCRDVFQPGR